MESHKTSIIIVLLLLLPQVRAEMGTVEAGVLPTKPLLWKIDLFVEKIQLLLVRTPEEKAQLYEKIMQERIAELKEVVQNGDYTATLEIPITLEFEEAVGSERAQSFRDEYNSIIQQENDIVGNESYIPTLVFDG